SFPITMKAQNQIGQRRDRESKMAYTLYLDAIFEYTILVCLSSKKRSLRYNSTHPFQPVLVLLTCGSWHASSSCPNARRKTMGRDTLSAFADAVLQQVRDASAATGEGSFLVSLPAYLDAAEVRLLQIEVNRQSG